jgi:hypothetical protein
MAKQEQVFRNELASNTHGSIECRDAEYTHLLDV